MLGIDASAHVALLGASALVTAALGSQAWRRRDDPGARPFALMMVAATVWSGCYAVALTRTGGARLFWEQAQWFGIATIPVFFFLFAMEYTGRDRFATRRARAALAVVPAVTVLLVWTNPAHGLIWQAQEFERVGGITIAEQYFGAWYWVNLAFAYGVVVVGSAALLRLVVASEYLYTDQAALLAVGVAAPLLANGASVLGLVPVQWAGIDLTPYAFTASGVAFGNALFRYRLFELLPATRKLGRQAALAGLDDGLLILDTEGAIIYMNPAAGDVLDCDPDETLGEHVDGFVESSSFDLDATDRLAEFTRDGRTYEVETATIADRRDRHVGYTVLLYDVTERKRRERELRAQRDRLQRLERINTVIREVNAALIDATTVEEATRAVVRTLVDSGAYEAAWLSTSVDEGSAVGMTAGDDEVRSAPGEALPEALDPPDSADEARPTVRPDGGDWATVAVVHGRTAYGALALRTGREHGFTERELAVLDELGETVGHALNAIERARLSVADTRVELDLASTDSDALLVALASETGAEWRLEGLVPVEDGKLVLYVTTTADVPAPTIEDRSGVTDVRRLDADGDTTLEVVAAGGSLAHPLVEAGANVRTATADGDRCRLVAEVAPDANVRTVVERVSESFPGTELLAKREVDPTADAALPGEVDMTDRQQEALEAAYRAGYFEWPRESSAEDVAESLDISAPTLHGHLRKAEHRLVDTFFAE